MQKGFVNKIVLSAVFLALGMILPLFTAQIKEIGDTLLPMHLPVLICGLICGWKYGFVVGAILPFLRAVTFGMPPLYPNAIWMSSELAAYGLTIGVIYSLFKNKKLSSLYISLIVSMICGRVVWGIVKALLMFNQGKVFTFSAFIAGGIIDSLPGIIIQLIIIPVIVRITGKYILK